MDGAVRSWAESLGFLCSQKRCGNAHFHREWQGEQFRREPQRPQ